MRLKRSLIIAVILISVALGSWEMYWRSQGYYPGLEDDKELWAIQRAKLEKETINDVVLLGSSWAFLNFQLNE